MLKTQLGFLLLILGPHCTHQSVGFVFVLRNLVLWFLRKPAVVDRKEKQKSNRVKEKKATS